MLNKHLALLAFVGLLAQAGKIKPPEDLFALIRQGDMAGVKAAVAAGADVNAKDAEGSTPLMYAALYSNVDCMRLLLDNGAVPNAANDLGATALLWTGARLEKVTLLVERGAEVNARSKLGKTALLIAAGRADAGPVVKYLLEHGARTDVRDELDGLPFIPLGGGANTPVMEAAKARDGQALRMLLEKNGDVNARAKNGSTALLVAIAYGNVENARLLIDHGADIEASVTGGTTPLILSAYENDSETAALLLKKGAKVDAEDMFGDTAFMWAAYSDLDRPGLLRMLLDRGADLNHKNKMGETALTWAARRGDTRTVEYLKSHHAIDPQSNGGAPAPALTFNAAPNIDVAAAIDKALPLLQKGGPQVFKQRGCISCHNNMMAATAVGVAQSHGHAIDQKAADREQKTMLSMVRPARELLIENGDNLPDVPETGSWVLIALGAQGYPADASTDALSHSIALKQRADGSWSNWAPRPPIQSSDIQATALSLRALQLYALEGRREEYQFRIAKAGKWLSHAIPSSTEDENMRILGITWAKTDPKLVHEMAQRLIGEQRPDGGWAQLATLESDAYATGETLYALHEAGVLSTKDAVWKRGVNYLLRTQQADGTWHVKTRSFPFQPYFESGFPYAHDQWISIAGSNWATIALTESERITTARR